MKIKNGIYQFLRRTQKYTGTDNVYLAKGGFWINLGGVVFSATSFLLAIAFANLLDPTTYGNYKYILSLVGFLGIFALAGMSTAIMQATARGLEGSFYTVFKTKLKWALLGSLVALGGAIYYWLKGNEFLPIPLLIIAIFLPLMEASRVYGDFLTGRKLFNIRTKYSIVKHLVFAGIMITVLFLTKNLLWLIAAYFVSHAFLNCFFYLLTKVKFKPNKEEDPQTLSYGKHLSLMGVISAVANYLDKILVFTLIGSSQLAIYAFAVIVPEEIRNILKSVNTLALPKLAARPREEIKKTIMKKTGKLFLLMGLVIVLYVIVAPYIYKIFFPQYLDAIPYSQIFILSLISLPTSLLGTVFRAKMMKKELYLLRLGPLVRIILLATLIPFYGIWGAIFAIIGAKVFGVVLILFLFRKF